MPDLLLTINWISPYIIARLDERCYISDLNIIHYLHYQRLKAACGTCKKTDVSLFRWGLDKVSSNVHGIRDKEGKCSSQCKREERNKLHNSRAHSWNDNVGNQPCFWSLTWSLSCYLRRPLTLTPAAEATMQSLYNIFSYTLCGFLLILYHTKSKQHHRRWQYCRSTSYRKVRGRWRRLWLLAIPTITLTLLFISWICHTVC